MDVCVLPDSTPIKLHTAADAVRATAQHHHPLITPLQVVLREGKRTKGTGRVRAGAGGTGKGRRGREGHRQGAAHSEDDRRYGRVM